MFIVAISCLTLALSLVLSIIRLVKGPTLADRVVALDLIAFITVGFISLLYPI